MIMSPGKNTRCGAVKTWLRSAPSMAPHSGVGGCAPSPRNDRAAASRIGGGDAQGALHDERREGIGQDALKEDPEMEPPSARVAET